jgi:hypothetical protein
VLVVIVTTGHVLIVTTLRRLGLAHGIGPRLDRQVIGRQLWGWRRRPNRAVEIWLLTRRVLAIVLILAVVLELATVVATNDIVVLLVRLILLLATLLVRLIVAAMALIIVALMAALPVLPAIGTPVLRLIGERLRSDTDTQQTNTGQTPDARLHAFPH